MAIRWFDLPNGDWVQLMAKLRGLAKSITAYVPAGVTTVTTDSTVSLSTPSTLYLLDTTAGDVTVTLPAPNSVLGHTVFIKKLTAANSAIVDATVDGASSLTWTTQYQSFTLLATETEYVIV